MNHKNKFWLWFDNLPLFQRMGFIMLSIFSSFGLARLLRYIVTELMSMFARNPTLIVP